MYELKKKIGKVFTSKFVGIGSSSFEKRIDRAAIPQTLRNTGVNESVLDFACVLPYLGKIQCKTFVHNPVSAFVDAVTVGTGKTLLFLLPKLNCG
jgi:superfamily II DNA/RNA helicase